MALQRRNYEHMEVPFGAFCHAVRSDEWLFVSGLTARGADAATQDIVEQTDVVMSRLKGVLETEGGSLADVIRVTVYVTSLDRLMEIHDVRHRYFGDDLPASTLVQVSALVRPELKVEIEAIARLGHG
jgi:2-iminobutanoate/2-iminopropanoate deaminase